MSSEKDVLDGWCVYVEQASCNGSASSDSESIEIISEDEAGNYQIYSKKYFHPESNISDEKSPNLHRVAEIKEYSENDPTHLIVEQGKEAQEKLEEDIKEHSKDKKFTFLKPRNKINEDKEYEHDETPSSDKKSCVLEPKPDFDLVKSREFSSPETPTNKLDTQQQIENKTLADRCEKELPQIGIEDITETLLSVENEILSAVKPSNNCILLENDNGVSIDAESESSGNLNNVIELNVETNKDSAVNNQNGTTNRTKEISTLGKKITFQTGNWKRNELSQEDPCTSKSAVRADARINSELLQRKKDSAASSKSNTEKKAKKLNLTNPPPLLENKVKDFFNDIKTNNSSSVKKARKRNVKKLKNQDRLGNSSSSGNEIEDTRNPALIISKADNTSPEETQHTDESADSMLVQLSSTWPDKDISILALITIIGSLIYILYYAVNLPHSAPVLPQNEKNSLENMASMHKRYAQLVLDWEAKVLENAELDFQIALREKSAELSRAHPGRNFSSSSSRVPLPNCLAQHLISSMFVYLRQSPPDIADLTSWGKSKFCVDLSLLLTVMRGASYSQVLKLLRFLTSPSSDLDYRAVFEHYLAQQRIYIQETIQKDYPEIYRTNVFQPSYDVRPCMYCVSMQRFSVLKSKYASEQDNMAALLTLSERYVQNDACLKALVKMDGRSVDKLYEMALDVLLSRSLSTAITLDPSLLHDYYLELILSNEENLRKLSRQLFKYNILAVQKFNLNMNETPPMTIKKKKQHKGQHSKKNVDRDARKEKFTLVREGDDEFLVLNRKPKKDSMKPEKDVKFTSLGKGDVELFYDSQLREISKGYSSNVGKFLADINKDLKHALCYPYANEVGMPAPASERNESLVRFIRNMCQTNVFNHQVKRERNAVIEDVKHVGQNNENRKSFSKVEEEINQFVQKEKVNAKIERTSDYVHIPSISGNRNSVFLRSYSDTEDQEHTEGLDMINVNTVDSEVRIEEDMEEFKTRLQENKKDVEEKLLMIPVDPNVPSRSGKYTRLDSEQITIGNRTPKFRDPEAHIYDKGDKDRVLQNPDYHFLNVSQDDKDSWKPVKVEQPPKQDLNNNMPDLWLLNKMANSFGLRNGVVDSDLNPGDEEEEVNFILIDESNADFNVDFYRDMGKENEQWDRIERVNVYNTIRPEKSYQFNSEEKESSQKVNAYDEHDRKRDERVNVYDTIRPEKRFRYSQEEDWRRARVNAYDMKPKRFDKEFFYVGDFQKDNRDRANREERIVHIDGKEKKYTRHVYIDNVERDRRTKSKSRDEMQRKKTKEAEMGLWLNRRAKLRAKLRQKQSYPSQDNPVYHYDYVYE